MTATFAFDDVPVVMPNGERWLATGEVEFRDVTYQPAEPDVGIFRWGVEDYGIWETALVMKRLAPDPDGREIELRIDGTSPIWRQIDKAMAASIEQALIDDYNDDFDDCEEDDDR